MEIYENTSLWKRTLGKVEKQYEKQLMILLEEFSTFRKNASYLAGEIASMLPEFTVHDITHIDALWEIADIFLPNDYELTPAEGFVLGGAFILHDLGMALAAYSNGMEEIKREPIWRDTVAALSKANGKKYDFNNDVLIDDEIKTGATIKTLRMLHAHKAKELALISWKDGRGNDIFLIENVELRHAYGDIIGRIARSHWLGVGELKKEFPAILGAQGDFPSDWVVDPLKIACIVRIADAMNIDGRRAPVFLKAFRKINTESELHWIFQEKLYKPRVENKRVVYTSKSPFSINEMNAWWLCYDTLKMIDKELKSVDSLLLEERKEVFGIQGVYGIEYLEQIQKLIKVIGWEPVDAQIRVNNVAKLVETMGGVQLYGDNYFVPLRELVQNAADAIRARRFLDNEDELYGNIEIIIGEDRGEHYIQIEDNGVGMSSKVLSGTLLDFGQSFWGTDNMHEEFPGLEQKEFHSTGKFGIGFFSVFMWGGKVKVISNKYNQSRENTMVLEFIEGINVRPILRKAMKDEQIKNGGTVIKVSISSSVYHQFYNARFSNNLEFDEKIAQLCFALDSNLYLTFHGKRKKLIKANDWIAMSNDKFYKRLFGKKNFTLLNKEHSNIAELMIYNLKLLKEESGEIVGRACLYDNIYNRNMNIHGLVVTDGLKATSLSGIVGIIKGEAERAARDLAIPNITQKAIDKWLIEQVKGMNYIGYKDENQARIAWFICALSQQKTDIKLAKWKNEYVNYDEIIDIVNNKNYNQYYLVHDAAVFIYERENKVKIELLDNVFICTFGMPGILQTDIYSSVQWPDYNVKINGEISCNVVTKQVISAISEAWGKDINMVEKKACFSDDEKEYNAIIGKAGAEDVQMRVDILYKV